MGISASLAADKAIICKLGKISYMKRKHLGMVVGRDRMTP